MITDFLYNIITNKSSGFIVRFIRITLMPLSWLYFLGLKIYEVFLRTGLIRVRELPCQVISIGNIVAGGTGKTPAAITVAKALKDAGRKPAVLLRGYRSNIDSDWAIVSDGENTLLSPEQAGDEAYMLTRELSGIPVLIGEERYRTGSEAIKRWGVDVIILDDGFQYRKLKRDIDILVIDATQPFGTGSMLPAGNLREPKKTLKRAELILITHIDQVDNSKLLQEEIRRYAPNVPVVESIHQPEYLYLIRTHIPVNLQFLQNKRVLAVCGIGNPESFGETLYSLGISSLNLLAFNDHHQYSKSDIEKIFKRQIESNSEIIVTTKKDEQKLLASLNYFNEQSELSSIYILSIKLKMLTGQSHFNTLLKNMTILS